MRQLPVIDKAALGATCRALRQQWQEYPWSSYDYGSTLPHRYLGPSPSREDWLAVTRERLLVNAVSVYPQGSSDLDVRLWFTKYCGPDNGATYPRQATLGLLRAAQLRISPDHVPDMSHRPDFYGRFSLRDAWGGLERLLRQANRTREAQGLADKLAACQKLGEAMADNNLVQAQQLLAQGTPLYVFDLTADQRVTLRPQLRQLAIDYLVRSGRHSDFNRLFHELVTHPIIRPPVRAGLEDTNARRCAAAVQIFPFLPDPCTNSVQGTSAMSLMIQAYLVGTDSALAERVANALIGSCRLADGWETIRKSITDDAQWHRATQANPSLVAQYTLRLGQLGARMFFSDDGSNPGG